MKIMISAGETSGDMYGASLVEELFNIDSNINVSGMGGQLMAASGVDLFFDPTELSTVGFVEALYNVRTLYRVLKEMTLKIEKIKPDLLIIIDFPGFNLKLARRAHQRGIKVLYFIPPAAWAWGGYWRARRVLKRVDMIASIFPFGANFYREAENSLNGRKASVFFVGHPVLDRLNFKAFPLCFNEYKLDKNKQLLVLMPGSRRGEVKNLLPDMARASEILMEKIQDLQVVLPAAEGIEVKFIKRVLKSSINNPDVVKVIKGRSYAILEHADYAFIASGTATLEAACLLTPMAVVYRASISTLLLSKLLLRISWVGLPNILAGREVVPELLQNEVTPDALVCEACKVLENPRKKEEIKEKLKITKEKLGTAGASKRTAKLAFDLAQTGGGT